MRQRCRPRPRTGPRTTIGATHLDGAEGTALVCTGRLRVWRSKPARRAVASTCWLEQPDAEVGEKVGHEHARSPQSLEKLTRRADLEVIDVEPRDADAHPCFEQQERRPLHDAKLDERIDRAVAGRAEKGYVGIPMHVGVPIPDRAVVCERELGLVEVERGQTPFDAAANLDGEHLHIEVTKDAPTEHVTRLGAA